MPTLAPNEGACETGFHSDAYEKCEICAGMGINPFKAFIKPAEWKICSYQGPVPSVQTSESEVESAQASESDQACPGGSVGKEQRRQEKLRRKRANKASKKALACETDSEPAAVDQMKPGSLAHLLTTVGMPRDEAEEDEEEEFLDCDHDAVELLAMGDMEVDSYREGDRMEITVDSGAGESVANPLSMPLYPVVPSAGSKRGQKYRGPGGEVIPNTGEQRVAVKVASGGKRAMTFQPAPVRKPLMAVSGACDHHQFVIFDNDGSYIAKKGPSWRMRSCRR